MIITLLLVSGCALQTSLRPENHAVDNTPGASTGITVFGDARLGVVIR